MKNQHVTPARTTRLAKYKAHDQPATDAINGVRVGAIKHPTLQPVFMIPVAAPVCLPPRSIAVAQKGPSEADARPRASESTAATLRGSARLTPTHSSKALSVRQA